MLSTFNFLDFFSAFIVLFAVIDPIGAIPIVISVREQGKAISAFKAVLYSFLLMITDTLKRLRIRDRIGMFIH